MSTPTPIIHLSVVIDRKRGRVYFARHACDLAGTKKSAYRYSIFNTDRARVTCDECSAISPAAIEAFRRLPTSVLESLGAWTTRTMARAAKERAA